MLNSLIKKSLYQKIKEFQSFILLLCIITLAIFIVSFYDKFKSEQIKQFNNILQNVYLQKSLISFSKSLKPRHESIKYVVSAGESFEKILNEIELNNKEREIRNIYTGSFGYIKFNGDMRFNIIIRSILNFKDISEISVASGAVVDSNAKHEFYENYIKAKALIDLFK